MSRITSGSENRDPEQRWPYVAENIREDMVALMLDIQFDCVLLETAAREWDRIEIAKVNHEIYKTAQYAHRRLVEAGSSVRRGGRTPRWPDYAEDIRLDCMDLCKEIKRACELLEGAVYEYKIIKVAAINDLIYRLARSIQNKLNSPTRFERGEEDDDG